MKIEIGRKYEMSFPNGDRIIDSLSKIETYEGFFLPDYFFYYISGCDGLVKASSLVSQNIFPLPGELLDQIKFVELE